MKDNKKPIYMVSGYMRTGSSMMMKALIAGGMSAVYRGSREEMRKQHADEYYDPNSGGLYELSREDYSNADFPEGYEGKLIKVLGPGIPTLKPVKDIKMIFMRRDSEEIRQSFEAFFSSKHYSAKRLDNLIERYVNHAKNRRDISDLHILWYRDVLQDPAKYFNELKEAGWPIDVNKALSVIDPSMCRFKKEELTIGI